MLQAEKNKYMYGATAEKLEQPRPEYNVYEENKVLRSKRTQRVNNKAKVKMVVNILVVFALGLMLMYRYALITEMSYNINKLNKQYNELRDENIRLKVSNEEQLDLQKVKQIAEERLGMQKADKYQIICVNVPKSDITITADTGSEQNKLGESTFAVLIDKIGRFTQLLY